MNSDLCIQAQAEIKKNQEYLTDDTLFCVGKELPGKSIVIGVDNIIFKPRYTEMEIPFKDSKLNNLLEEVDEIVINGFHYYKLSKDTRK